MPIATVTIRELKNKVTKIDVSIPTTKEIPGLLGTNTEYHVVVVTSLKCFKSSKHKDTDVVQFMITKQLNDFNAFHEKLCAAFTGTLFPSVPKKMAGIIIGSNSLTDRKAQLEKFLTFVTQTKKTCFHYLTLEFFGVGKLAAQSFINSLPSLDKPESVKETTPAKEEVEEESPKKGLFGGDEEGEDELFGGGSSDNKDETGKLFTASPEKTTQPVEHSRLFEEQDFGGGVAAGENEELFFVTGAKEMKSNKSQIEVEDSSDLLNITDDIDSLLKKDKKDPPPLTKKPEVKTKPSVAPKPRTKKPPPPPKPGKQKSVREDKDLSQAADDPAMNTDDILKYIQANTGQNQESDLNLF